MLKPGDRIDGYEVVSQIGAGGMGTVLRAKQVSLGRDVALKLVQMPASRGEADPHFFVKRFQREIEIQSRLDHPNLVKVYDSGAHDGNLYVALELVEGHTLAEALAATGRFPVPLSMEVGEGLLEGLAYLHDRSIVHRDLKPGNVMITPQGEVKVLDFGLARADHHTQITRAGNIIGTLAYIAPEVLDGGEAGAPADVYAVGLILYQMLIGRMVYQGEDFNHWCMLILNYDPAPLHREVPAVPLEISTLVTRMLAKEAGRRPDARTALTAVAEVAATMRREDPGTERATRRMMVSLDQKFAIRPRPVPAMAPPSVRSRSGDSSDGSEDVTEVSLSTAAATRPPAGRSGSGSWMRGREGLVLGIVLAVAGLAGVAAWRRARPAEPLFRLMIRSSDEGPVWVQEPRLTGESFRRVADSTRSRAGGTDAQTAANLGFLSEARDPAGDEVSRALLHWETAARLGLAEAQLKMGWVRMTGEGATRDPVQAATWLERAAASGSAAACTLLGRMHLHGLGVPAEVPEAVRWLERAAERGDPAGMHELAALYERGTGVPLDHARALELFVRAADRGDACAMKDAGTKHYHGKGTEKDLVRARVWYERAAAAGNAMADFNLGVIHTRGEGVAPDPAKAASYFLAGAELGMARCAYQMVKIYRDGTGLPADATASTRWLARAAELGHPAACLEQARVLSSVAPEKQDLVKIANLLEKAAEGGNAEGMFLLGWCHEKGAGVEKTSFEKAALWYEKAVAAGHAPARPRLGRLLEEGIGVAKPDPARARQLYEEAANAGDVEAQYRLGRLLARGVDGAGDPAAGRPWLERASLAGYRPAADLLAELAARPGPER